MGIEFDDLAFIYQVDIDMALIIRHSVFRTTFQGDGPNDRIALGINGRDIMTAPIKGKS